MSPRSLFATGLALALAVGTATGDGADTPNSSVTSAAVELRLVRRESFTLGFAGLPMEAPAAVIGRAELVERRAADGRRQLEFAWDLDTIATHVDQFVRELEAGVAVSQREWRQAEDSERITGHTLVLERRGARLGEPGGQGELREWAGGRIDHRFVTPGLGELEVVDRARSGRPGVELVPVFSTMEGVTRDLWVVHARVPAVLPGAPALRHVALVDPALRDVTSEWVFVGRELSAFRIGEVVGRRALSPRLEAIEVEGAGPPVASAERELAKL